MSGSVQDLLAAECTRQGVRASSIGANVMFAETAGRLTEQGMILLPGGVISVSDYVRSYRKSNPEAFLDLASERAENRFQQPAAAKQSVKRNLTQEMAAEIRRLRSQGLPIR